MRPDGRPSRGVCKIGSDTGRTVHFRAVCAQRGALKPDVRPWRRHMIGWPIWPAIDLARPCECHATTTHVTAAVEGVCWHHPRPERHRLALCHLCRRTCDSPTNYWDCDRISNRRELALGTDAGCLVLSWNHSKPIPCLLVRHKYRHTNHHAAASLSFKFVPAPLGATHDTNAT